MEKEARPFPDVYDSLSPRQRRRGDVQSIRFNVRNAEAELTTTRNARLNRARRMAPVLLGEQLRTPVLVMANPFTQKTTGFPRISHHGVLMHDPQNPERMVMLFFRDTDGYFAGFQRCEIVEAEGTQQENWGTSFFFDDMVKKNEVPGFFEAVKMGIGSAHSEEGDFPGPQAVVDVFHTLFGYEDGIEVQNNKVRGLTDDLKDDLKIAVARIIILFCEATRLRTIYNDALAALGSDFYSVNLTIAHWKLLHSWGKISNYVLTVRKNGEMDLNNALDPNNDDLRDHNFPNMTLGDLIGPNGELTMCKIEVTEIMDEEDLTKLLTDSRAWSKQEEPTFVVPVAEEAQGGRGRRGRRGRGRRGGRV